MRVVAGQRRGGRPRPCQQRVGRLAERWPRGWAYVEVRWQAGHLSWRWDREALRLAGLRDGAYLLRTKLTTFILNQNGASPVWGGESSCSIFGHFGPMDSRSGGDQYLNPASPDAARSHK